MKFIEEIVVEAYLPTVRSLLAERLLENGFTQHEVASVLGLSQSAVSKYAHGSIERHPVIANDERVQETIQRLGEGIVSGSIDSVAALIELEVLIRELEAPGDVLTRLHEEAMPQLRSFDDPFAIHDPQSTARHREHVRTSVRQAVRRFASSPKTVQLLPQVGSNIVEITDSGTTVADVVGVPGRLIGVSGQVEVPADPDFGVSGHLAPVLIASREAGSTARAALNIRYDHALIDRLEAAGETIIEVRGDQNIQTAIQNAEQIDETTGVIAQTGGFGIEPIIYLLAPDAPTVVDKAMTLLE